MALLGSSEGIISDLIGGGIILASGEASKSSEVFKMIKDNDQIIYKHISLEEIPLCQREILLCNLKQMVKKHEKEHGE